MRKTDAPALPSLLPCPFCGKPAELDTMGKGGSRHAIVSCADNLCPGMVHGVGAGIENQRRNAIASWNCRAPSDAAAEISRLQSALEARTEECAKVADAEGLALREPAIGSHIANTIRDRASSPPGNGDDSTHPAATIRKLQEQS